MEPIIRSLASRTGTNIQDLSAPTQSWFHRGVVANALFTITAEALAIVGIAYHSVAATGQIVHIAIAYLHVSVGTPLSLQEIYLSHLKPLVSCFGTMVGAPLQAFVSQDKAKTLQIYVDSIFEQPQPTRAPSLPSRLIALMPKYRSSRDTAIAWILLSSVISMSVYRLWYVNHQGQKWRNLKHHWQNLRSAHRWQNCLGGIQWACIYLNGISSTNTTDGLHRLTCQIDSAPLPGAQAYNLARKALIDCKATPLGDNDDWILNAEQDGRSSFVLEYDDTF